MKLYCFEYFIVAASRLTNCSLIEALGDLCSEMKRIPSINYLYANSTAKGMTNSAALRYGNPALEFIYSDDTLVQRIHQERPGKAQVIP